MTARDSLSRRDFLSATAVGVVGLARRADDVIGADERLAYVGTYTADGRSKGIYRLFLDTATGALRLAGLAVTSANPSYLALHPNGRVLYAVNEIAEFAKKERDFKDRDAVVLGASTDNEFVHLAWMKQNEDLKGVRFPMLADLKRELSQTLGILDKNEGVALRATFIADPEGIIRFASVHDLNVGRNVQEVLRTLDALQTDELCPCNWQKGEPTLEVA